ncbi:MAG: ZIP family metal transporter [Saccharofermentans sp.]|nr:ZIP family metal transporter [Saccharofermentans sp.]
MNTDLLIGLTVPFLGTALGSGMVFLMKSELDPKLNRALEGFASGVMVAASIWSLIVPAMEQSEHMGRLAFLPAAIGFWLGILFLLALDHIIPHLHMDSDKPEGPKASLRNTTMMVLAVTLHNIPEGMAVGVVYAAFMSGQSSITSSAAFALAAGIAIQNFPEGAIISLPLHGKGESKFKSFMGGALSGLVEPIGTALTILASSLIIPILPYTLGFAAGAMIYVVVEELIPEMSSGEHLDRVTVLFALGFTLMMALDVALG